MAIVCPAPASDPAPGSVNPKLPMYFPYASGLKYFSFCSGVPKFTKGSATRDDPAVIYVPVDAHLLLISSIIMA